MCTTREALLKVLETFVAGVIFAFLSSTSLQYLHQPAPEWCGRVLHLLHPGSCGPPKDLAGMEIHAAQALHFPASAQPLLSVPPLRQRLVLWPLYQFSEELGDCPSGS